MDKIMDFSESQQDPQYSFPNISSEPLRDAILDFFALPHAFPASEGLRVKLFQRSHDRVITNLKELERGIQKMVRGTRVSVGEFDLMCLKEQIEFVREADILIGAHGSGLALMMFMKPNATVIEIFPYKFTCGDWVERAAKFSQIRYIAYHPESESEASGEIDEGVRKCFDGVIECSSALCSERLRNQNITVNVKSFRGQVEPQLL
jgi:hypothetical protein